VLWEKQKEKQRVARMRERSEGYLHQQDIVEVDSTEKSNCNKSDKNNEERRVKKSKPASKTKASARRKANVSKDKNKLKRRKIDVSSETAKGRRRVLLDVNDMNMSRRPLRRSTRLSTGVTTYNQSSSEDEEMEVKNDLLPVSIDNDDSKAKGKSTTLSTVARYNESSSEDEDMEISDNLLPVSVDEECRFKTCVFFTMSKCHHTVYKNATFDALIVRVKREEVHNSRDQDDVQFKVHTKGCKCNVMSNFFNRLNVNFEKENCEYFMHRKGVKEIKNVMIVLRDKTGGLKTDDDSVLVDEQELYETILNEKGYKELKISFAQCGLKVHHNGFTCIFTKDSEKIHELREMRENKTIFQIMILILYYYLFCSYQYYCHNIDKMGVLVI
jgi:hypothetical protein